MDGTSGKRATGAVGSDVPPLTADKDAREMSAKPTDERPAQPAPHAALRAGVVAADSALPVLGVPMKTHALEGKDSLLSIMQMPGGVPVGTLAERLQIPVASTLLGLGGFPVSHELSLGMMGMHGEAWVNQAIQQSDLLIACGMRFDDRVTGVLTNYAPNAKKIHIEIDPSEVNKNVKADVALIGDLREILETILPRIAPRKDNTWLRAVNVLKGDAAVRDIKNLPDLGHLYAAHVIHDLWHATDGKALVVTAVGQHQMWEAQYYKHESPRSLITSGGLGTMGFALPAAIGAKIACPEKEVWVIAGDGGFQMTAAELSTIVQEKLHINIAVINNGYLGMVRQWQDMFFEERFSQIHLTHAVPDYAALARAYGAECAEADKNGRSLRLIGIVTTCFGFGLAFGPLLAGVLATHSFELPFAAAGGLCLLGAWVVALSMREDHATGETPR